VKARTVEELLVQLNLSQEEKERHAELIQECVERERKLFLFQRQSEEELRTFTDHAQTLGTTIEGFHMSLRKLHDRLGEVLLRRIPESKFSKA
jgi:hypothetical protein